jgi:hypothetical protein
VRLRLKVSWFGFESREEAMNWCVAVCGADWPVVRRVYGCHTHTSASVSPPSLVGMSLLPARTHELP